MRMREQVTRWIGAAALALGAAAGGAALSQGFTSARVVEVRGYLSFDKVHPGSSFRVAAAAVIAEGWHVNAHEPSFDYLIATRLEFRPDADSAGLTLAEPIYPPHVEQAFSFTDGKSLRVYDGTALIGVEGRAARKLAPGPRTLRGVLTVQACNDNSCLAPARLPVEILVPIAGPSDPVNAMHPEIFSAIHFGAAWPGQDDPESAADAADAPQNEVRGWIERRGWLVTLVIVFGWGLALNLTPCVYPVIPITLAYFGGQASGRPARTFGLAAVYVLGMCVTYSALGVAAALGGSVLGAALQSPFALGFIALVMLLLALSMFGLYDIQVPAALRNRLGSKPGPGGALFMGLTVGLVAAPCVGPVVVSLLTYVAQVGRPGVGFLLFFVLSLGLGLPYLVLGGMAGTATGLPRAGVWMVWVKKLFGCLLLAMAAYFLNPLLPDAIARYTIPAILLVSGLYLGFVERSPMRTRVFRVARLTTAGACALAAVLLMEPAGATAGVAWEPYTESALAAAAAAGRPALIDFTAEWCLPCKELDRFTFSNDRVVEESRRFVALKADITSQVSAEVKDLLARYEILGAPTIVFIDSTGRERRDLRLTGFEKAAGFLARMEKVR